MLEPHCCALCSILFCFFFVATNQGILPCGFMSPRLELCSACDSVQSSWRIICCVGASLLNSMHRLSCYSFHYQCSWYALYWTKKKKTASALCKFLKLLHCQFFGMCFVSFVMWSHLVYYCIFFFYIWIMCIMTNQDESGIICVRFKLSFVSQ